ncbi:MAG: DAK2 domain-containing protein [Eubacteriaceae bacterium]|jgi:DAK2 domain fusion protein YloV
MGNQTIDGKELKKMFEFGAKNLELNKKTVDELNVFPVPDGDTGTNMSLTFKNAVAEMNKLDHDTLHGVAKTASSGALIGARGNSGVILSQLLRGFAASMKGKEKLEIADMADAFKSASDAAYKAVMKPTEGTILTVARKMGEFAAENADKYTDTEVFLNDVLKAGNKALQETPELLPVLKEAGVVDSGGQGLMFILEGAYKGLTNQDLGAEVVLETAKDKLVDDSGMKPEDITFGYCTEFIIKDAQDADDNELREYLNSIGDCTLVIKDDDIVKVHVHTDHPGKAFEKGLTYGPLTRMKIDNMREMLGTTKSAEEEKAKAAAQPPKPYGFVAVSPGPGLTDILKDLGITEIITGGQTMNPSTQDFLEDIDKINAEHIFLFPNNGNIILAANQAEAISERSIHVVPTRTIPQCIAAMLVFDPEATWEENLQQMNEAITEVKTGEITYAVRDTKINGLKIAKNNIIGLTGGEIVAKGRDIDKVAAELLDKMVDENSELISLYYGNDVSEEDAKKLSEKLEEKFSDCDFEVSFGGQPLYYYIISVE